MPVGARKRLMLGWASVTVGACLLAIAGIGGPSLARGRPAPPAKKQPLPLSLTSRAFRHNGRIPAKHTCDGKDISPDLAWSAPPSGTVQLALICDDPDAPRGGFTHWLLYALPGDRRWLPEAVPTSETLPSLGGARQGRNSFGQIGYRGPCPPKGPAHHYHFRLYALNAALSLSPGARQEQLEKAMKGHVIGQTELVGLYSR
jgi:Raf kinase inhibitor-like YbhB/YbcL family protein